MCDMLWSDPDFKAFGWEENERGVSYLFGPDVVRCFLEKFKLDLICRAHQVVEDGYEFLCNRKLITIFSAPNYCGEFDNSGAVLIVDKNLICSLFILKPQELIKVKGRPKTPIPSS